MKRVTFGVIAAAAAVSACATDTGPVCRAPAAHEMAAFRAMISHNETAVADMLAPGALRAAFVQRDPAARAHIWGSNGDTRGSVIDLLSRPPLCIIDDPAMPATDASRQVIVYPQAAFNYAAPAIDTPANARPAFPYGVIRRDYMTCRFEQTASGWKLADMCGFEARTVTPVTG